MYEYLLIIYVLSIKKMKLFHIHIIPSCEKSKLEYNRLFSFQQLKISLVMRSYLKEFFSSYYNLSLRNNLALSLLLN
jgi:hypothetical protein